jgi:hypothetical protein
MRAPCCDDMDSRGKEIHVIADNLSAHKSAPVEGFLEAHPKVHLHFTPKGTALIEAESMRPSGLPYLTLMALAGLRTGVNMGLCSPGILETREPLKARIYEGDLWKHELENTLMPMIDK